MTTKRHVKSVRCIQLVRTVSAEEPVNYVISGGFGFRPRPGYSTTSRGTVLYECLVVTKCLGTDGTYVARVQTHTNVYTVHLSQVSPLQVSPVPLTFSQSRCPMLLQAN